jgi:DNA polymerase-4
MIGKMESRFGKKPMASINPVEPYTERKSIATEHTFVQDTIDITHLKAILCGMVESWLPLRSEEWLTLVVVK